MSVFCWESAHTCITVCTNLWTVNFAMMKDGLTCTSSGTVNRKLHCHFKTSGNGSSIRPGYIEALVQQFYQTLTITPKQRPSSITDSNQLLCLAEKCYWNTCPPNYLYCIGIGCITHQSTCAIFKVSHSWFSRWSLYLQCHLICWSSKKSIQPLFNH